MLFSKVSAHVVRCEVSKNDVVLKRDLNSHYSCLLAIHLFQKQKHTGPSWSGWQWEACFKAASRVAMQKGNHHTSSISSAPEKHACKHNCSMQVKKTIKTIVFPGFFWWNKSPPKWMLLPKWSYPIGSMYGICSHIYHKNVGKYSIHTWIP